MRTYEYVITPEHQGQMIKGFLRQQGYSTRIMTRLKTDPQGILLNGAHARTVDLLQPGDRLTITFQEETPAVLALWEEEVPILYEDRDLLVFDKPSGMPVHPCRAWQNGTLANVFAAHLAQQGEEGTFRALNRLDRDTTGTVLVAKNPFAANRLSGTFEKEYVGVVQGRLDPPRGTVDAPIARENPQGLKRCVSPHGQRAVTHYQVVAVGEDCSLVAFRLETGRTHQIRVHMSYLGHPLAGDPLYGGSCGLLERQGLHCRWVRFVHPLTGQEQQVVAPLPPDLCSLFPQGTQALERMEQAAEEK